MGDPQGPDPFAHQGFNVDGGTPRNAPADGVHGLLALDGTPPAELYRRGRAEVRGYGGLVVTGEVSDAAPTGDLGFTITLTDGRSVTARRVLVATGTRDVLPDVPGLARHWGHGVVHCPYCHGWEVRDEPIGILAGGPGSVHQALLFRQLSEDLLYFRRGTDLDDDGRARLAARGIRVVEPAVEEVLTGPDGAVAGVRLGDGEVVDRRVLAVTSTLQPRTAGLERLGLPVEELPGGTGHRVPSGMAGTTEVPGVWVAGNITDPMAQVGASAAAGALAGAHINAHLVTSDVETALAVG